jgi:hypothetical protein
MAVEQGDDRVQARLVGERQDLAIDGRWQHPETMDLPRGRDGDQRSLHRDLRAGEPELAGEGGDPTPRGSSGGEDDVDARLDDGTDRVSDRGRESPLRPQDRAVDVAGEEAGPRQVFRRGESTGFDGRTPSRDGAPRVEARRVADAGSGVGRAVARSPR